MARMEFPVAREEFPVARGEFPVAREEFPMATRPLYVLSCFLLSFSLLPRGRGDLVGSMFLLDIAARQERFGGWTGRESHRFRRAWPKPMLQRTARWGGAWPMPRDRCT